jgi:hypothetical protein
MPKRLFKKMATSTGFFNRPGLQSPVPTRMMTNGEFTPIMQTDYQKRVEQVLHEYSGYFGRKTGMDRRAFLRSSCGMAAAFLAMNTVYGSIFSVEEAEAADPACAAESRNRYADQFIFDVQLHFVHDDYPWEGLLGLRRNARKYNIKLKREKLTLEKFKFKNFIREVFLESQTSLGLLSGAPSDDIEKWFLKNKEIAQARASINAVAGSKRLFSHAIFTPGQPGWLEEIDRAIEEFKPDSWKGYTIGDPLSSSDYPWRMDDEKLVYPAYEKMVKSGIRTVCVHKGLLPADYKESFPETWQYAKVDDVGKAAKDWPELNFIIYHSALKPLSDFSDAYIEAFERTGHIPWVTELSRIPEKYGVSNLYAELGTSFGTTAVTYPRHSATLLGALIKGFGKDRVLWGTDSVWYGSPQWQIEAFRRIEIPEDLQKRFGLSPLGPAAGKIKNAIFGLNAARLYNVSPEDKAGAHAAWKHERLSALNT